MATFWMCPTFAHKNCDTCPRLQDFTNTHTHTNMCKNDSCCRTSCCSLTLHTENTNTHTHTHTISYKHTHTHTHTHTRCTEICCTPIVDARMTSAAAPVPHQLYTQKTHKHTHTHTHTHTCLERRVFGESLEQSLNFLHISEDFVIHTGRAITHRICAN